MRRKERKQKKIPLQIIFQSVCKALCESIPRESISHSAIFRNYNGCALFSHCILRNGGEKIDEFALRRPDSRNFSRGPLLWW